MVMLGKNCIPDKTHNSTSIEAVEWLGERFRIPLENAVASVQQLCKEFCKMVLRATLYQPWDTELFGGDFSTHLVQLPNFSSAPTNLSY